MDMRLANTLSQTVFNYVQKLNFGHYELEPQIYKLAQKFK